MRHLVIVARDRPELHDDFRRRFNDDSSVSVIFDRRIGQRRQMAIVRDADRRDTERRQTEEDAQAKLWVAGYVIVRAD